MTIHADEDPLDALREIMRVWPTKEDDAPIERGQRILGSRLAPDFDPNCLFNTPKGEFSLFSPALVTGDAACIMVRDFADDKWPNKAILVRRKGRWLLKSFRFLCPACFGTGFLDAEPCYICDASGWGASSQVSME